MDIPAHRLADAIKKHWHDLGFRAVKVTVEVVDGFQVVRSNLKNGLPPNHYYHGRAGEIMERPI